VRKLLLLLLVAAFVLVPSLGLAGTSYTQLAWDANVESDLAGYRLYQTTVKGQYIKVVDQVDTPYLVVELPTGVTTFTVTKLPDGIYYWVVTAFDLEGLESGYSNEVGETHDTETNLPPANPQGLRRVDSGPE